MTDRELMQEALYALTYVGDAKEIYSDTIESLRARLAQPEEPDWSAAGFSKPPTHSEAWWRHEVSNAYANGYEKGRASVKQSEQEPVVWMHTTATGEVYFRKKPQDKVFNPQPVYTTPPQREWQGLTDEEIAWLWGLAVEAKLENMPRHFARMVEENLRGKNNGTT